MMELRFPMSIILLWSSLYCTWAMMEHERVKEYHKRYDGSWPPTKYYIPQTEGWKSIMNKRLAQAAEIDGYDEKYEAFLQTVSSAITSPNFTEYGFGLVRAPQELTESLQKGIRDGLEQNKTRLEYEIKGIDAPQRPLFIDRPDLMRRVLAELQSYSEGWAKIPLTPAIAYGFRLYRNDSALYMHVDKSQTHVISMIYHIDHSEDSEDWPIYIEDFLGKTHEVVLTAGDILFYESSKCFHGRPKRFRGSWYTSVFVHYYPTLDWKDVDHKLEAQYAIRPDWDENVPYEQKQQVPLQMVETSFREPSCPNNWCATQDTVKWSGPGKNGIWIAPNMAEHEFVPKLIDRDEL